jgi:uncharacterized membrane protein
MATIEFKPKVFVGYVMLLIGCGVLLFSVFLAFSMFSGLTKPIEIVEKSTSYELNWLYNIVFSIFMLLIMVLVGSIMTKRAMEMLKET